jgi:hypothetical protein
MEIETLDADFFRGRAHLCHKLADTARAAKPLFTRLFSLAKEYEERAKAADVAGGQATTELKIAGPAYIAAVDGMT